MITQFFEGIGGKLGERVLPPIYAPALVFWLSGLLALASHNDTMFWGWGLASVVPNHELWLHVPLPSLAQLSQLSTTEQVIWLIGSIIILVTSAELARGFILGILRLAEGYWPHWLDRLRDWQIRKKQIKVVRARHQLETLSAKSFETLTPSELNEYIKLDNDLLYVPSADSFLMPTELGNILRAAETRPADKYGLDSIVCWPRLWLLLPENAKQEVTEARATLDLATLACFWSLISLVWGLWAWWVIPVGLSAGFLSYRTMLVVARSYGDLVEAAYDVHRVILYEALRWPLPNDPLAERDAGQEITQYLWRVARTAKPVFSDSSRVSPNHHKALTYRFIDEVISKRSMATVDEIVAPECMVHHPALSHPMPVRHLITTMPHLLSSTERTATKLIAEGDTVVALVVGRQTEPSTTIASTHALGDTIHSVDYFRFADGKMIEWWHNETQ